jgi:hypothetical protein
MSRAASMLVLAAAVLLGAGCGYTTRGVFPEAYGTVAVPVFENRTFYRGVELEMTEAVIKAIESRTPYAVVSGSLAETRVTGVVREIEQDRLTRRRRGATPNQLEVRVLVDLAWVTSREEVIDDRLGLTLYGEYAPAIEVGEPLEVALRQAVAQAGDEVVWMMQSDTFEAVDERGEPRGDGAGMGGAADPWPAGGGE